MLSGWFGGNGGASPAPVASQYESSRARSLLRAPSMRRTTTAGLTPAQILTHLTRSGQFHVGRFKQAYVMDGTVLGQGTFGCVHRCFSAHAPDQGEGDESIMGEERQQGVGEGALLPCDLNPTLFTRPRKSVLVGVYR